MALSVDRPVRPAAPLVRSGWGRMLFGYRALLASWPVRGFREAGAGHLAAILAYNGMVALVPTFLLLIAVAGFLLRQDDVLGTAIRATYWALPADSAREALNAALTARRQSGWFALASLLGFAWVGTGFVGALNHCLNRIYGAPDCGFICSRRRGIFVVAAFAALFSAATVAAALPTLFVKQDLGPYFRTWALAGARAQTLSYGIGFAAAALLYLVVYRAVPTAGQQLADVWPGSLVAAALFVALGQAFPVYFRLSGGANRFGAAFALVSLLVGWFALLAHVTLFGCYVNASYRRRRLAADPARAPLPPVALPDEPGEVAPYRGSPRQPG